MNKKPTFDCHSYCCWAANCEMSVKNTFPCATINILGQNLSIQLFCLCWTNMTWGNFWIKKDEREKKRETTSNGYCLAEEFPIVSFGFCGGGMFLSKRSHLSSFTLIPKREEGHRLNGEIPFCHFAHQCHWIYQREQSDWDNEILRKMRQRKWQRKHKPKTRLFKGFWIEKSSVERWTKSWRELVLFMIDKYTKLTAVRIDARIIETGHVWYSLRRHQNAGQW